MTKRRRQPPSASVSMHATMTDQPQTAASGGIGAWLKNQFWNTSLIWLLGFFVTGSAFYYDTTRTLATHTIALSKQETRVEETSKENSAERAKVREQFLADSKASAIGIAELNKQTAVMSAVLIGMQRELEKIGAKLDTPPARGR